MNKLTAEKCMSIINGLKWMAAEGPGMSIRDEYDIQAYEIALPILEQQERGVDLISTPQQALDENWAEHFGAKTQPPTDTYRQIENDGWIEWRGGARPVRYHAGVNVRYRDGEELEIFAGHNMWTHSGEDDDIIAYRVIENDGREG